MKLVKPVTIDDTVMLSSTVPETDYSLWSSVTTYIVGNRIRRPNHIIYESLVASNLNNIPENTTIAVTPAAPKWLEIGKVNRWRMFDALVDSYTEVATSLVVDLASSNAGALCLFGLLGATLNVKVISPELAVVYDNTVDLEGSYVTDWSEYFFTGFSQVEQVVLTDLPVYYTATVRITITGSTVRCGHCVLGGVADLGSLEYGATAGIIDYSRKDTDAFGNTTFIQRAFSKRMSGRLWFANTSMTALQRMLASVRAVPCVWIGTDDVTYDALVVYGYYKDFNIEVAYPDTSYCSLEIEGLI